MIFSADRFVMLASEKTSRSEEVEATAILMETVKVLGDLKNKGDENRVIECLNASLGSLKGRGHSQPKNI